MRLVNSKWSGLGFICLLTVFLHVPSASAKPNGDLFDDGGGGFCDASVSGDACMAGWDADPFSISGGGGADTPCVKATSYNTCIKNCDCEFNKAKKKCNGGLACVDLASGEHDACSGKCITDFTS